MLGNNPFESIMKQMSQAGGKLSPEAAQVVVKQMQDSLKAWGQLATAQAQAVQATATQAAQQFQGVQDPMGALAALQAASQQAVALTAQHLGDAMELGLEQFTSGLDLLAEKHPAPQVFAPMAKAMKSAAVTTAEQVRTLLRTGTAAAAKPAPAKKAR